MLSVDPSWVIAEWQLQHVQSLGLKHPSGKASLPCFTWTQQPLGGSQTLSQRGDDHRDLSHTGALAKPACLDYLVGPPTVLEVGTSIPTLQREKQRP